MRVLTVTYSRAIANYRGRVRFTVAPTSELHRYIYQVSGIADATWENITIVTLVQAQRTRPTDGGNVVGSGGEGQQRRW